MLIPMLKKERGKTCPALIDINLIHKSKSWVNLLDLINI